MFLSCSIIHDNGLMTIDQRGAACPINLGMADLAKKPIEV
jgi:hypothetical protein